MEKHQVVLKPYKNWSRISVGQISMGHEVAVSAMQLATAFAAIANGGFLVNPYIVEQIVRPDNKIEKKVKNDLKEKLLAKKL